MSLERSGFPVAVCAPETTQLPEPATQPSQTGFRRVCWRARRSLAEAVRGEGLFSLVCDSSSGTSGMSFCGTVRSTTGWAGGWSRQVTVG